MYFRFARLLVAITAISLLCWSAPFARPVLQSQYCHGCDGSSGSGFESGSAECPSGYVGISALVANGLCDDVIQYPDPPSCAGDPCHVTITRSWSNLSPNTSLDFCFIVNGQLRCISPPPSSGSGGSGSDVKEYDIACDDEEWEWQIVSAACNLAAFASGSCSECWH